MRGMYQKSGCSMFAALLVLSVQPGMTQGAQTPDNGGSPTWSKFGGPDWVPNQLARDAETKESVTGVSLLQDYFDWKDRLREDHGISYTFDYTSGLLYPSETLGTEDLFSSGVVRFIGIWDLIGRDSGNTGTFVFKGEHRHRYTDIPVSGTAQEIGYAGLILPTMSDIGYRLSMLGWDQKLREGRIEVYLGFLDLTEFVDAYPLASPWTGFYNFSLANGSAAIPWPDDGTLGAYLSGMITENLYITAGLADNGSDSTDPFKDFDSFFNDNEYFSSVELGLTSSKENYFLDNTHVTLWHTDEREEAGVSDGWGAAFSFSRFFGENWIPFLRAAYTDDGGSLLQKTVNTGFGYKLEKSQLGVGFIWGQPNEDTFGAELSDQYATEFFCRLQLTQNIELTPDIQLIFDPAFNPEADEVWVFGLRTRVAF